MKIRRYMKRRSEGWLEVFTSREWDYAMSQFLLKLKNFIEIYWRTYLKLNDTDVLGLFRKCAQALLAL